MAKTKKKDTLLPLFREKQDFFSALASSDGLRHAYLFFGDEGVGKFTFASFLARFLEEGEFGVGVRPLTDLYVLAPDEDGKISVDDARGIKGFLSQKPVRSQKRCVIVKNAEVLTPEAQAACLKIVEEPPASALIIFTSTSPEILFPPLASRLLKVYFPRMSISALVEVLSTHYGASSDDAKKISLRSHGRIGLARELLKGKRKKASGLTESLAEEIISLRDTNLIGNSKVLSRLLRLEESLHRYNLNERIQEKAFRYLLRQK